MKLLRETVRKILLQEGMATPNDLPRDIGVCISEWYGKIDIFYCEILADGSMGAGYKFSNPTGGIWGIVKITNMSLGAQNCNGALAINGTEAKSGYGPLLYDIAMEVASMKGTGLVADRRQVSKSAQRVWQYYLQNRVPTGEIKVFQCDDENNSLTKPTLDNLNQKVARETNPEDWTQSPLSKRYSKEPTNIDQLGNKLVWLEG
jgi:hypothetical protein